MIVYVIEEGEYSDRHIVAVRESLDDAKSLVDMKLNKELKSGRLFGDTYAISAFDTKGGIVYPDDCYEIRFNSKGVICEANKVDNHSDFIDWDTYKGWMFIHAKSEEQARKIAYDRYAQIQARKAGIV